MKHDDRVARALLLLESLSTAPNNTLSRTSAASRLGCTTTQLDGYVELLSSLADRMSGARVSIACSSDSLTLIGDGSRMAPLRLSMGEGIALAHVLGALHIEQDAAERLSNALLPLGMEPRAAGELIGNTISYGSSYQKLAEAIEDGIRCRILYRSQEESTPSERLIDPLSIEVGDQAAYLIAWDVAHDGERRYRLDRIASCSYTDDSVERHQTSGQNIAESLASHGSLATVECSASCGASLDWAGIASMRTRPDNPDRVLIDVMVSSPKWLFDEVLSYAGDMFLVKPLELSRALSAYARDLSV